jgi:hypothetical protein
MAYTTIDNPTDYFNTLLYTGNGTADRGITGVGFQPDWVWFKNRADVTSHKIFDSVRGAGLEIETDTTDAEVGTLDAGKLPSFDSDGFTVSASNTVNGSSDNMVAWNWLAGGSASSNTNGSITSSVSANTTAGFSIVSYTGTGSAGTIGHGLGATPSMILVKNRSTSANWMIWHQSLNLSDGQFMEFNNKVLQSSGTAVWDVSEMSSTNIGIGSNGDSNGSGNNLIAYCFADKKGYSKFGKYIGNNNDDGAFVYTGFKPAFLLIKLIDTQTDNWIMQDNKINTFNSATSQRLRANSSGAEFSSSNEIDLLSNGFKVHGADGEINGSGSTYIYMAFAEAPFVSSGGVPTTAR